MKQTDISLLPSVGNWSVDELTGENVMEGDRYVCTCETPGDAERICIAMNTIATLRIVREDGSTVTS